MDSWDRAAELLFQLEINKKKIEADSLPSIMETFALPNMNIYLILFWIKYTFMKHLCF